MGQGALCGTKGACQYMLAIQTVLVYGYVSVVVTLGCVDAVPMNGSIPSVAAEGALVFV